MAELEAFFRDLRALRTGAGLSLAELAERAHFPEETLAAAETGPAVPANPVLVAYVGGCGGPLGEWEDRWRDASAAAVTEVPALADVPETAPPRGRPGRRVAVAVAAVALLAGGSAAVVLARPAGHATASAGRRTSPAVSSSPSGSPQGSPQPRPVPRHSATSAPRMTPGPVATPTPRATSGARAVGVGCPDSPIGVGVRLRLLPWQRATVTLVFCGPDSG